MCATPPWFMSRHDGVPDENYTELIHGWVVPSLASYAIVPAASTLGAVIMPHNLYLHSGLACEHEKVNLRSHRQVADAIRYARAHMRVRMHSNHAIRTRIWCSVHESNPSHPSVPPLTALLHVPTIIGITPSTPRWR